MIKITMLRSVYALPTDSSCVDIKVDDFFDMLADTKKSEVCKSKEDKLQGDGFILAQYKKGKRSKEQKDLSDDSNTSVLCYDIDAMDKESIAKNLPLWQKYHTCLYSTWKHTKNAPRYRLLIELDSAISNKNKEPFNTIYLTIANKLGVIPDKNAKDTARFYLTPQHMPDSLPEGYHFKGKKFPVSSMHFEVSRENIQSDTFEVTLDQPENSEIKAFVKKLRKGNNRAKKIAVAFDQLFKNKSFAPQGSRHTTMLNMGFELVRQFPEIDANWFADKYLKGFTETWSGEFKIKEWLSAVNTAKNKQEQTRIKNETLKNQKVFTSEVLKRIKNASGRLVLSSAKKYFVYNPLTDKYDGMYSLQQVPIAIRDCYSGSPDITETEITKNGIRLKSAVQLTHEYGQLVKSIIYTHGPPLKNWDDASKTVYVQAYEHIKWNPVFHPIVDELLRAISGEHYNQFIIYLSQFQNLEQPLPALTLVGAKATWKSRLCEILSRFWTQRDASSPGRADVIMNRFNGHLLVNPVVWSDEQLATTHYGKPQPEAYRESITAKTHMIEPKGGEVMTLTSAVRHLISVNDDSKIFSTEVDTDSIYATMERFLLLYTDTEEIAKMEYKWKDTEEMSEMRKGNSILEHVSYLQKHLQNKTKAEGRLYIMPHTDARILLRARFNDDRLLYIWQIAFESLYKERTITEGRPQAFKALDRLPLVCDENGVLRLKPNRIAELWNVTEATTGVTKISTFKINTLLTKAGFKLFKDEKAANNQRQGWTVNTSTLKQFIDVSDFTTWAEIKDKCLKIFGKEPL